MFRLEELQYNIEWSVGGGGHSRHYEQSKGGSDSTEHTTETNCSWEYKTGEIPVTGLPTVALYEDGFYSVIVPPIYLINLGMAREGQCTQSYQTKEGSGSKTTRFSNEAGLGDICVLAYYISNDAVNSLEFKSRLQGYHAIKDSGSPDFLVSGSATYADEGGSYSVGYSLYFGSLLSGLKLAPLAAPEK